MKRKLLVFFLLCIGICLTTFIQAQENFANPVHIGLLNGIYECGVIYSDTDNSCDYADDVTGTSASPDVVYMFNLNTTATVNMNTCTGTSYDSYLHLFDGTQTQIYSNDDACGIQSEIEQSLPAGTYYIVVGGWSSFCGDYTLQVSINEAPIPLSPVLVDLVGDCSVAAAPIPTAIDYCDGVINGTCSTFFPVYGSTVITWSYEDLAGNISTQTQNIIINDVDPPVPNLTVLPDLTGECEFMTLTDPTATDACGGPITVTHDAVLPIGQGTTIVTWTYEDTNGNATTQTQNVIIEDNTDPVFGIIEDIVVSTSETSCSLTSLEDIEYYIPLAQLSGVNISGPICNGTVDAYVCNSDFGLFWNSTESQVPTSVTVEFYQSSNDNFGDLPLTFNGFADNNYMGPIENCVNNLVTVNLDPSNYIVGGTNFISISSSENCLVLDENPDPNWTPLSYAKVTVGLVEIGVTDNCGIESITNNIVSPLGIGDHVITWTATDFAGNSVDAIQNVTVVDFVGPTPDLAVLPDVTSECEVSVLIAPTATDACGGLVTVTNDAVLPINTQGTTVVTWTYEDVEGNTSTQTQNVVIDDVTPPVPDQAVLLDLTDPCGIMNLSAPTATDACSGVVTVTNDASLPIYGTSIITWSFDDGNGNIATQTQNVIINDIEAPVPDLALLTLVAEECEVSSLEFPTATDGCGGNVTVTNDAIWPIRAQGTTVVTWTYMDDNGNSSTQTQNVMLNDVTAPEPNVSVLPDITADCAVTSLVNPDVTDNCGGTIIYSNDAVFPITGEGTTTVVTWTYEDVNGNTSTQTQNVIIEDLTPPVPDENTYSNGIIEIVIAAIGMTDEIGWKLRDASDVVIISGGPDDTGTYTASSSNGPYTFIAETQGIWGDNSFSFDLLCSGTNFLSGTISGDQYLTFNNLETCLVLGDYYQLPDYVMECGETFSVNPTATDACTGVIAGTTTYSFEDADVGTHPISWTYNDGNGNILTQVQDIVIVDLTSPVPDLAVLDPVNGSCEVTELTAPTSTDNCGGEIVGTTDITFPIEASTTVEWTYDDGNGNITTQTQSVVIEDVTAPVPDLALLDDVVAECEVTSLEEPTATDVCSTEITVSNDVVLPITMLGTTVVTWTYEDANGNIATQTQNVIIEDNTDPVFGIIEDIVVSTSEFSCSVTSLEKIEYYIPLAQLSGVDINGPRCNGTVDAYVCNSDFGLLWNSTESQVPTSVTVEFYQSSNDNFGDLPLTFNGFADNDYMGPIENCVNNLVTVNLDPSNYIVGGTNFISISSSANCLVLDENPVPSWIPHSYAKVTVKLVNIVATDNCGIASITNNIVSPLGIGDHVVTWTATDFAGNSVDAIQNVTVVDLVGPTPDLALLPNVNEPCELTTLTEPIATDNCGGLVTITSDAILPITENTTITWTYEDENGNITTQEQVVIIDYELPVPDELVLNDIVEACSVEVIDYPTATDNCAGLITGVPDEDAPYSGSTTVTWTFDDGHGNVITQTQNIIINDNVPPAPDMPILDVLTDECSINPVPPIATDNCAGEVIGVSNIEFPITEQGTTVILWSFEDLNGNSSSQEQTVIIEDITPPEFEVLEPIQISTGELSCDWNDFDSLILPTVTDNCEMAVVSHDLTDPLPVGNHTITWTAIDAAGNENIASQEVEVVDLVAPVPDEAVLPDLTANCEIVSWVEPTATDVCFGAVTGVANVSLPIFENTIITWTYTDNNSNEVTQTQNVIIGHNIPPTPDVEILDDVVASCEVTSIDAPSATSECAEPIIGTTDAVFPITEQGSTIVTWTYTDDFDNVTTQNQHVFIMDYNDPVPNDSTLSLLTACDELTELTAPTATDDCFGIITGVQTVSLPITISTTLIWTFEDENGNTALQTQSVVINTVDVSVTNASPVLTANASGATYQWLDCDDGYAPLSGETNQSFVATEDGNYAVEVTQNGCTGISDCISVNNSGISDSFVDSDINVYPNPTSGLLYIEFSSAEDASWKLINITGQVVLEGQNSSDKFSVNMEDLASGVYILNIQQNDRIITKRVVRK